jgi:hypothetical protein
MRIRTVLSISILILTVLIVVGSCATSKKALPTDNIDELVGTWVNTEYENKRNKYPKRVYKADGKILTYVRLNDEKASFKGKIIEIGEKWMEGDGSIYFKYISYDESFVATFYALVKLSPDRSFCEEAFQTNPQEYSTEFDLEDTSNYYRIYYRQE